MIQESSYHEEYAYKWFLKSIKALQSHKCEGVGFIRNSKQLTTPEGKETTIFPTATFQGYSAFFDCEINLQDKSSREVFTRKTKEDTKDPLLNDAISEVKQLINKQEIGKYIEELSANKGDRAIILLEHVLYVMSYLKTKEDYNSEITFDTLKGWILGNTEEERGKRNKKYYFPAVGTSPWFLLTILYCQDYVDNIYKDEIASLSDKKSSDSHKLLSCDTKELENLIDDHINYHLARYNTVELSFDSISLAIAVCCKIKLNRKFKDSPFFFSCLKAIIEQQYSDGCLPTGATISFEDSGDVIQQASIQVMFLLVDAIVDYKFLVDCNDQTKNILEILCPALRKLANYMVFSYENIDRETKSILGWSSDRLKVKECTETWITAYTCRFFHRYWLLEKAYSRIISLRFLGVHNFVTNSRLEEPLEEWEKILDPDAILTPKSRLDSIVTPLINKRNKGLLLVRPTEQLKEKGEEVRDLVSFIICGPPGSGKTFIVKRMSEALGWPLVELSPSQFIKDGLDFIESTSKEIFAALNNLHHAVVFFDECDELFRSRNDVQSSSSSRTILNFLTASMLPKLQKLHDNKSVIFAVGTNYLYNIDSAVRRGGRFDFRLIYDRPCPTIRSNYYKEKRRDHLLDDESDVKDFVDRTETALVQQLEAYLNTKDKCKIDMDYVRWCRDHAPKELEATKYDQSKMDEKTEQWKDIESKYKEELTEK